MTDRERTCRHEAGHAAAAVVLGVPVRLVDTVPRTEPTPGGGLRVIYGEVRYGLEDITNPTDARKRALVILCGLIEGYEDWSEMPAWPLNPNAATDEYNLHAIAEYLGLDEWGYKRLETEALQLTLDRLYRNMLIAITGLLDYTPRIGPELFAQIEGLVRRRP